MSVFPLHPLETEALVLWAMRTSGTERLTSEEIAEVWFRTTPGKWEAFESPWSEDWEQAFYGVGCPHGCPDEECEGHREDTPWWYGGPALIEVDGGDAYCIGRNDAEAIAAAPSHVARLLELLAEERSERKLLSDRLALAELTAFRAVRQLETVRQTQSLAQGLTGLV